MRALAAFIMRSRVHAGGTAALLLLGGWLFAPLMPLMSFLSGGAVALASLRHGPKEGLAVIAVAGVVAAAAAWAGFGSPYAGLLIIPGLWLPVWLCAVVLRYTRRQGVLLFATGLMAALLAGGLRLSTENVTTMWREQLQGMLTFAQQDKSAAVMNAEAIGRLASAMNSIMAASVVVSLMIVLLLARWWQSMLYNPGGFSQEFRRMCLPRLPMMLLTTALLALVAITGLNAVEWHPQYATDLLVIVSTLYAFQGLAAIHNFVAVRGLSIGWLVGLYVLLLVQALPAILLLVAVGLADSLMDRRGGRAAEGPPL